MAFFVHVYCHLALLELHLTLSLPVIILPHSILSSSLSFFRHQILFAGSGSGLVDFRTLANQNAAKVLEEVCVSLSMFNLFLFVFISLLFMFICFIFFILCSCSLSVIWTFLTHQPSPISPMDGGTLMVT